jgi:hypothetical protein
MTWIAWHQEPPYDPNSPNGRTFDPDTGNELFVDGSYSDGFTSFRIFGQDMEIRFTGNLGSLSESEKCNLKIDDAIVWEITSLNKLDAKKKNLICEALQEYKLVHGSNTEKNHAVFIRFDRGLLFNV